MISSTTAAPVAKSFFASQYFNKAQKHTILALADEEEAINAYQQLLFLMPSNEVLYLPSFDTLPYDRVSPKQSVLSERAKVLSNLATDKSKKLVVTSATNLIAKLPLPEIFAKASLKLTKGSALSVAALANFLVSNGFTRSASAIDSGEFALRGEIVDIVLAGLSSSDSLAYRINFNWDKIESIRKLDVTSQISSGHQRELILTPASEISLNHETMANFKSNYLTTFGVNHAKAPIYEAIIAGQKFPGYEYLLPLFYDNLGTLFDYFDDFTIIYDNLCMQAILEHEYSYQDFYQARAQSNKIKDASFYPALPVSELCLSSDNLKEILANRGVIAPPSPVLALNSLVSSDDPQEQASVASTVIDLPSVLQNSANKIVVIFCSSKSALERIKNIVQYHDYKYLRYLLQHSD